MPETNDHPKTEARTIVCPDGTQYVVYADGAWLHETWDGLGIRTDADGSTTREEVVAKLGL